MAKIGFALDRREPFRVEGWLHIMSGPDLTVGKENLHRLQEDDPLAVFELREYLAVFSRINDDRSIDWRKEPGYSIWRKG